MKQVAICKDLFPPPARLVLLGALIFAGNVFAGISAVEGIVRDAEGRPIGGADIRVEARSGSNSHGLVKSDARGHYIFDGLTPGTTYRVTLLINGAVKASINNILAITFTFQRKPARIWAVAGLKWTRTVKPIRLE